MNSFLPDGYKVPVSNGNFMKLEKGDNIFRVLSPATTGYEYWTKDSKPVRSKTQFVGTPADAKLEDGQFRPKHFWAFVVWNYKVGSIQVLEITQRTIMTAMENLIFDEDWGDPRQYDIKVTGTGDGLDREYAINPKPSVQLKAEIAEALESKPCNLEALFDGSDPFDNTMSDGSPMPTF